MNSPYLLNNGGQNFGPASGLAGLMATREQIAADEKASGQEMAMKVIGHFVQQGAAAAAQGAKDADAAKLLNDHAKVADSWAKTQFGQSALKEMGVDSEAFKSLDASSRLSTMTGYHEAQGAKKTLLEMERIGQQMQAASQEMNADEAFGQGMVKARNGVLVDTWNQGQGPVRPRATTLQDFAAVADPAAWQSRQAGPLLNEMAARGQTADFNFDPTKDVKDIGGGLKVVRTSRGGGQVVQTPESIAAAAGAKEGAKRQISARAMPVKDFMGNPTGEYQMQVDGDPEEVAAWIKKNGGKNAAPAEAGANIIMTDPTGRQVNVPATRRDELLKKGYK